MARAASSGGGGGTGGNRPNQPSQRSGARYFLRESWAELRKVQWPTKQQVATGTLVVGVVTAVLAGYIAIVDQIAVRLVQQLNQFLG
ncbi:MAG: preprotein translocase subunit SecE [Gaiellales bacterium]